ncbi:MAG: hypothetical protein Q9222_005933 [Ikaeria aurantiellina]
MDRFNVDETVSKKKFASDMEANIHPVQSNNVGEIIQTEIGGTERGLKARHAQMIAIGGTIGTGLFVGSGQALSMGGPLTILLAYCIFLGFAMGWMYWYIFSITVPAEVTATALVIDYWEPPVHIAVWITLSIVVIVALNCFPVKVYGEAEFWFASLKVFGIIGLLVMSFILVCCGGPSGKALSFTYWNNPGPVKEFPVDGVGGGIGRLRAFVSTITFSVFAFAFAPELLVVTGGEMQNPRRQLPVSGRTYLYRLLFFYVLGVFAIRLIVSSDNPNLLNGTSGAGSSQWAVAILEARIKGLDSVVSAVQSPPPGLPVIRISTWPVVCYTQWLLSAMRLRSSLGAVDGVFHTSLWRPAQLSRS